MTLLEYIRLDPNQTTEQYAADLAVRRRLGCSDPALPQTDKELRRQLSALATAGLIRCEGGCWEAVELEPVARVEQGQLF